MQKSTVAWIQIYTWRHVPPTIKISRWHRLGGAARTSSYYAAVTPSSMIPLAEYGIGPTPSYYAAVTPSSMIRIARVLPQLWIHSAKLLKGE